LTAARASGEGGRANAIVALVVGVAVVLGAVGVFALVRDTGGSTPSATPTSTAPSSTTRGTPASVTLGPAACEAVRSFASAAREAAARAREVRIGAAFAADRTVLIALVDREAAALRGAAALASGIASADFRVMLALVERDRAALEASQSLADFLRRRPGADERSAARLAQLAVNTAVRRQCGAGAPTTTAA
jgi:hypothetical protein